MRLQFSLKKIFLWITLVSMFVAVVSGLEFSSSSVVLSTMLLIAMAFIKELRLCRSKYIPPRLPKEVAAYALILAVSIAVAFGIEVFLVARITEDPEKRTFKLLTRTINQYIFTYFLFIGLVTLAVISWVWSCVKTYLVRYKSSAS